jgi:uncharacterized protein (DUF1684 family)
MWWCIARNLILNNYSTFFSNSFSSFTTIFMKQFLLINLTLFTWACNSVDDYVAKLELHRNQSNQFFMNPASTILDSAERITFTGLQFFPADKKYLCEATIIWDPQTHYFDLPHTGGNEKTYMKAAELYFIIDGNKYRLTAYQTEEMRMNRSLFVPFSDATNGKETYGGGRYLDIRYAPQSTKCMVDFNYAYAPWCAHAHAYSCPIVPKENLLPTRIEAGERK